MKCSHGRYRQKTKVENVVVGGIEVKQLVARVSILCSLCGEPFVWKGPAGFSTAHPMVSPDGSELRAPMDFPLDAEDFDVDDDGPPTLH